LRLRPILMTSVAFIAGVFPLVISTGAGAEMRQAMGIAVFAGMIGVTLFGLFLTPVFYTVLMKIGRRKEVRAGSASQGPVLGSPATGTVVALMTLLLTAAGAYGIAQFGLGARLAGFLNMRWITGLVGLLGIALVMTYPVRRQIFTKRAGALRYWMLAHSYIGVIAGIMILLHGGTDSGGAFTTILMICFDLVILTGLFGIFCYLIVPRLMTRIEGEPLLIEDLLRRRKELQDEIAEAANSTSETVRNLVKNKVVPHFLSFGNLLKQYLKRASLDDMIESAKLEFHQQAAGLPSESDRQKFMRAVEAAATLRRVDALIFLHRLLKAWLVPHVVFTSLMLALMVVHIIQVIYFA